MFLELTTRSRHAKLLQKLQKIGISGKMYDYIKTFLSGRSMQVRWIGAMSVVKTVSMAVPQGSVIPPLLFNIMVHDVVTAVTGKVVITIYADDLAIWLDTHIRRLFLEKSTAVKRVMKLFQAAVDGIVRFTRENEVYFVHPQNCMHPLPHKQSPQQAATCQDQRWLYLRFQESQVPGREFQSPRADQSTSGQQREERFSRPQCHQGPQRAALG